MHACTHARMHARTHAHMRACTHACMHGGMHDAQAEVAEAPSSHRGEALNLCIINAHTRTRRNSWAGRRSWPKPRLI